MKQSNTAANTYEEVRDFLFKEAELLDNGELEAWLDLVTDDIHYHIPAIVTKSRDDSDISEETSHIDDNRFLLEQRVKRYNVDYAWAESPPSRTRHILSNIRTSSEGSEDIEVKSNFLFYRNRGDESEYNLLAGERHDDLRRVDGELKLAERTVLLDQSALASHNVSFII